MMDDFPTQLGWDDEPPEPPAFMTEPPDDDGWPPAPPDAVGVDTPSDGAGVNDGWDFMDVPFDVSDPAAMVDEPFKTDSVWERYLDCITATVNPDYLEQAQAERGRALGLLDARFIGLEYQAETGETTGYGVGCIEVYQDATSPTDVRGSYVEISSTTDALEAIALYDTLQTPFEQGSLPVYAVYDLANFVMDEKGLEADWQPASEDELAIYHWYAGHDLSIEPPAPLVAEVEVGLPSTQSFFQAVSLDTSDTALLTEPPPYVDNTTGMAYWVGVYQPDVTDEEQCIASILSVGRDATTGGFQAQATPYMQGNWEQAYISGQHLLTVMEQRGIDACFMAAEAMAVASGQRDLWQTERGIPLSADYAEQAANYTRDTWSIDL